MNQRHRHARSKGELTMDTMNLTKIVGGVCGALLVYLLINWVAESMYHTGGGHGEGDHAKAGYVVEVETAEATETEAEGPSLEELLAVADVDKGKKVFSKCKACHKLEEGANDTGPTLYQIYDRAIGAIAGFGYSAGMAGIGGNWDAASLDRFIAKPKDMIADTKMSFAGIKKAKDRANLIAYLKTFGN